MAPQENPDLSFWKKAFAWLDRENDRVLGYHGPPHPPPAAADEVWLPAALHTEGATPADKAVQYCQCQRDIRKTGGVECVTTSAVIARNLVRDELAARQRLPSAPQEMTAQAFVDQLDASFLGGWGKRVPSGVPAIGGFMHPTLQLPNALRLLAKELESVYGCSFHRRFTWNNSPDDLLDNLRNNRVTLIHGIWNNRKIVNSQTGGIDLDPANLLGGTPHTMPLVLYAPNDRWWFYDLGWKPGLPGDGFFKMSSEQLITFWGRCYPLGSYTPRFAMTTLVIDD